MTESEAEYHRCDDTSKCWQDANTLLPVVQANIAPSTVSSSNGWAACNALPAAGYQHQGHVTHQQHFIDPVIGVHTKNIEFRWNACITPSSGSLAYEELISTTAWTSICSGHVVKEITFLVKLN